MITLCRELASDIDSSSGTERYDSMMSLFPFYSQYYQATGQDRKRKNLLKIFMKKALDSGKSKHIYVAHTHMGTYHFYRGESSESHRHFVLAAEHAEHMQDFFYLMQAYNNLSVNEPDPKKSIEHLYKALKYTEYTKDIKNRILIISNILESVPSEEAYKLIASNKDVIIKRELKDTFILNHTLKLIFNYIKVLENLKKEDEIQELQLFLKDYKINKRYADAGMLRELCLQRINASRGDITKKMVSAVRQLVEDVNTQTMFEVTSILFEDLACIMEPEEFRPLAEALIDYHRSSGTLESVSDIMIWYRLEYGQLMEKPELARRYMDMYYRKSSSVHYIRNYIYLFYSYVLEKLDDGKWINYLSHFIQGIKEELEKNPARDIKRCVRMEKAVRLFPGYRKAIMDLDDSSLKKDDSDCKKVAELILEHNTDSLDDFFGHVFREIMECFGYERVILARNHFGTFTESMSVQISPFIYDSRDVPLYHDVIDELNATVLHGKAPRGSAIKDFLIMPIVDKKIWARVKQNKRYNYSVSKNPMDFLMGFIYFDKKHDVSYAREDTELIQQLTALYISEFWQSKLAEDRFMRDKLTGLYFRDVFLRKVSDHLYEGDVTKDKTVSLMMVDIDDFKTINDTFGHQKGDTVLREISRLVLKGTRSYDVAGRYGGEEFIIALHNTSVSNARKIAARIKDSVEDAKLMGAIRPVTVSIGISHYPDDSLWMEELIQKADNCLYMAKTSGKNSIVSTADFRKRK